MRILVSLLTIAVLAATLGGCVMTPPGNGHGGPGHGYHGHGYHGYAGHGHFSPSRYH